MQRKKEENLSLLNIAKNEVPESETTSNYGIVDSGTALQHFLDSIPISSIPPGITNSSSAVEIRAGDSVGDAIRALSENNALGGLIADEPDAIIADDSIAKFMNNNPSNRYIGFIDFARLFLWSLQECGKQCHQISEEKSSISEGSFFSMLDQNPDVARTKIVVLAKSFIWHPFLPVQLNDTLLHVLLLFSKHRPEFLPVVDQSAGGNNVTGFVTESGVIHLLLMSSGLEWFDQIADKPLHDFRFDLAERTMYVFGNQSIDEAIDILWKNRDIGVVAVVQSTKRLIGWVRRSDIHLLLDNHELFHMRKSLSVEQFIKMSPPEEEDNHLINAMGSSLTLRNNFLLKMDSPATARKTDTLKQVMEKLAKNKSSFCFLVDDESQQLLEGVVTLRDVMLQFAPPSVDSRITGGSFFETALEQTGCRIQNGTVVCDR
ncbi:SNF1-related protein kinase regulatory subunit gamma-1-like [Impatiens glandulifera]|uniref:SNF1-related protein kinase regulatory subunit gamma-1-like n=1 Tax=Impatiens glandulifera TaxID=253017 RepID=UPI001FB18D86|nr:SNF1-related protein kinase regulatory subunit gamma-1-like [Impatiens glandulifera]